MQGIITPLSQEVFRSGEPDSPARLIEIRLRNGHSIVVRGPVDGEALSRVIDLLVKR